LKKNGINIETNSKLFSSSNFNNLDIIKLEMTSSMNCSTIPIAESEIQTMVIQLKKNWNTNKKLIEI
jgi:hypothetical protein